MIFEQSNIENKSKTDTEEKSDSEKEGKVVCAWCGKDLGTKKGINGTSHGMCKECYDEEMEKMEKEKKK